MNIRRLVNFPTRPAQLTACGLRGLKLLRQQSQAAMGKNKNSVQQQQKDKGGKQDKLGGGKEASGVQLHYSSYIQVLASDIDHNSPSLLLFTDKDGRMLFNAGEGLQRLFRENKLKMQKLETYFFTRVSTETMSGLPGMLLSSSAGMSGNSTGNASDAGGLLAPPVTCSLYGPRGVQQYVTAFKPYVNQEQQLRVQELGLGAAAGDTPEAIKTKFFTVTPLTIKPVHQLLAEGTAAAGAGSAAEPHAAAVSGTGARTDEADGVEPCAKRLKTDACDDVSNAAAGLQGQTVMPAATNGVAQAPGENKAVTEPEATCAPGSGTGAPPSGPAAPADAPIHWPGTGNEAVAEREAVVYVCEFATVPGKFDPKKAAELGVQKGPAFGRLQRGESVTTQAGVVVEPHQVMNPPSQPGPVLLVMDLPSEAHLAALEGVKGRQVLQQWLPCDPGTGTGGADGASGSSPARMVMMAHLTNARMAASGRYRTWMESLGSGINHLMCSLMPGDTQAVTLRRATMLQAKLNSIHPTLFPLLHPTTPPPPPSDLKDHHWQAVDGVEAAAAGSTAPLPQVVAGRSGLKLTLTPIKAQGLDVTEVGAQGVDVEAVKAELASKGPDVLAAAAAMRPQAEAGDNVPPALDGIPRGVARITFLGTASSQPSKYRNVTALYLDCGPSRGGMLLDCGEDTLGQMKRVFGVEGAEEHVRSLRCVWVSHMHADHHGGLYRLLELRARLLGRSVTPLLIIGPWPLFPVLTSYQSVVALPFHFLSNTALLPGGSTHRPPPPVVMRAFRQAEEALGVTLHPFTVHHIAHACGLKIRGAQGRDWSVVFSGDTRPCNNTVEAARGASLLIHEATFEDDMVEDAVRKRHSTTGDALGVAAQAGVYRLILTHFSTRYPTLPRMDLRAHPNVACATDFMTVDLADLPWLPRVTPALGALFREEAEAWEQDEGVAGATVAATTPSAATPSGTEGCVAKA